MTYLQVLQVHGHLAPFRESGIHVREVHFDHEVDVARLKCSCNTAEIIRVSLRRICEAIEAASTKLMH